MWIMILEEYPVRLTRSKGAGEQIIYLQSNFLMITYQSILPKKQYPYATTDNDVYSWTLPGIVASVNVKVI